MQTQGIAACPVRDRLVRCDDRAFTIGMASVQNLAETFASFTNPTNVIDDEKVLTSVVLHAAFVRLRAGVASLNY